MNDTVKVGLDEWLTVDAGRADLITDGLNGCVAIGLVGNGRAALTHVFSECNDATSWQRYREQLDTAFAQSGLGDGAGEIEAVIVHSDDTGAFLPGQIRDWLLSKQIEPETRIGEGCRIRGDGGRLDYTLKDFDKPADYDAGFKTSADAPPGVDRNALSPHAGAATKLFADPVEATPLLSQPEHPGNPLYRSILEKIGEMKDPKVLQNLPWAQQVACALTEKCLRAGVRDGVVEGVVFGEGPGADLVFALKPELGEKQHEMQVDVFETDETTIAAASRAAYTLLREPSQTPPGGTHNPAVVSNQHM